MSDDALVYIKRMKTDCTEMKILTFLSSDTLSQDSRNHCVRVLDVFPDSEDPTISYVVMPFLRDMDRPPFAAVGEVADFVDQILQVRRSRANRY